MNTKDYFKKAVQSFVRSFVLLAQGIASLLRTLFTRWPNITWAAIVTALCIYGIVQIGRARQQRDRYNHEAALLQNKLDSIEGRIVRYSLLNAREVQP